MTSQLWPCSGQCSPIPGKVGQGPIRARFGPKSGQNWSIPGRIWPNLVERSASAQIWLRRVQNWPSLTEVVFAKIGPKWTTFGPSSTKFGQSRATSNGVSPTCGRSGLRRIWRCAFRNVEIERRSVLSNFRRFGGFCPLARRRRQSRPGFCVVFVFLSAFGGSVRVCA